MQEDKEKDTEYGKPCRRKRISINNENFYLIIGDNFVQATIPYENRPDNAALRNITDSICSEITKLMGGES